MVSGKDPQGIVKVIFCPYAGVTIIMLLLVPEKNKRLTISYWEGDTTKWENYRCLKFCDLLEILYNISGPILKE